MDINQYNFKQTLQTIEITGFNQNTIRYYTQLINNSRLINDNQKTGFIKVLNDKNSKYITIGSVFDNGRYNIISLLSKKNKSIKQVVSEKLLNIYATNYKKKLNPFKKN